MCVHMQDTQHIQREGFPKLTLLLESIRKHLNGKAKSIINTISKSIIHEKNKTFVNNTHRAC